MKTHLGYWATGIAIAVVGFFMFNSWRAEHDARLVAETKIVAAEAASKVAESTIKQLQTDVASIAADRDSRIANLEKQRRTVSTPAAAIAAIPELSNVPLAPTPDGLTKVSVDAMALFTELNSCKQTEVKLGACEATAAKSDEIVKQKDEIIKQKDIEVSALKKKPAFWQRVKTQIKTGAFWVTVTIAAGKVLGKVVL